MKAGKEIEEEEEEEEDHSAFTSTAVCSGGVAYVERVVD